MNLLKNVGCGGPKIKQLIKEFSLMEYSNECFFPNYNFSIPPLTKQIRLIKRMQKNHRVQKVNFLAGFMKKPC